MKKLLAVCLLTVALTAPATPEMSCLDWYELSERAYWADAEQCFADSWPDDTTCLGLYAIHMAAENLIYYACILFD